MFLLYRDAPRHSPRVPESALDPRLPSVLRRCYPIIDTRAHVRRGDWRTHIVPRGRVLPRGAVSGVTPFVALAACRFRVLIEVYGYKVDLFVRQIVQSALRARYLVSSLALVC